MSKLASQSPAHPWDIGSWPPFDTLNGDHNCDVLIVGAGIAGLTTAYFLAKEGRRVTVIDASRPGDGETGNTTAHLSSALDDRFWKLEKIFGREGAYLAAESHRTAINAIEAICEEEGIDCDFERVAGYLFAPSDAPDDEIQKEYEAAKRAGFHGLEIGEHAPIPSFRTGRCLRFPQQAQVQPLLYLQGLTRAIFKYGGQIFVDCEATDFKDGKPALVTTRQGFRLEAEALVIATNTPINNRFKLHTKQYPYRTYVQAFAIDVGALPKALFWDTLDPYHYVRTHSMSDTESVLIVGGEDHKVGQESDPETCFRKLEAWARRHFPEAKDVVKRWSGQVMEPMDSLAFIGRNPGDDNIYIATGDSGHGMTHGTIAGLLISDKIQDRASPWEKLYNPSRVHMELPVMREFLKENLNVALQYADYFSPGDKSRIEDLPPGEGGVFRQGLRKIAVFRDEAGQLHQLSATCPHLGGIVRWNKSEKTWDCPCHGSRFTAEGDVVNGPAINGLHKPQKPIEPAKEE